MCGLVGLVNVDTTFQKIRKDWFKMALFVDQIRGPHATGVYQQNKRKNGEWPKAYWYKRALPAADFLSLKTTEEVLRDADNDAVVMGHNRFATAGDKRDDDFAHPFTFKDITLFHNGSLRSRKGLSEYHVVDSYSIAKEISKTPAKDYTKVLETLEGSFCLVWVNRKTKKVYFARNEERPLYIMRCFDGKTILYASEAWMLTELMIRLNGYDKIDKDKDKHIKLAPLSVGELLSVSYDEHNELKLTTQKFEPTKLKTTTSYSNVGYGTHKRPSNSQKPINLSATNKGGSADTRDNPPFKKGDYLYASKWDYTETKRGRGRISGTAYDDSTVLFSVGNVSKSLKNKITKEYDQCIEMLDSEDNMDVLLEGKVCAVAQSKQDKLWTVNLQPKSLRVDFFDRDTNIFLLPQTDNKTYKVGNDYVKKEVWLEHTQDGCFKCGNSLYLADHTEIEWIEVDVGAGVNNYPAPICDACQHEDKTVIQ